jgi:hypothetical protein
MLLSQIAIVPDSFPFVGAWVFGTSVAAKITYELIKANLAKDEVIKSKDEVIKSKDDIIKLFKAKIRSTEAEFLAQVSKAQAVLANRILLESALDCHFSKSGTNKRNLKTLINSFISENVIENSKLRLKSFNHLNALQSYGISAREDDILRIFMNSAFEGKLYEQYRINPIASGLPAGVCLGGQEPFRTALALCMLLLQESGDTPYELLLLDLNGKPKCKLVSGTVQVIIREFIMI